MKIPGLKQGMIRYYFDFLWVMTEKEIKARYKHAVFGFLWLFINPLLQMLIIGFVFQFFVDVPVENYFLFLFTGLLPWNFFSYTVIKNTPIIVYERALIQKARFPREVIILSMVLSNLFHLVISLVILLIFLFLFEIFWKGNGLGVIYQVLTRWSLILPLLLWLTVLASGTSLLFSALNVRFRDINLFVQALIPLWFYATPVIYTLDLLPKSLHAMAYLNPMTSIIELFHLSLLGLKITSPNLIFLGLLSTAFLAILGWWVFRKESPFFDDWV